MSNVTITRSIQETGPFVVGQASPIHLIYTFTGPSGFFITLNSFQDDLTPLLNYNSEDTPVFTGNFDNMWTFAPTASNPGLNFRLESGVFTDTMTATIPVYCVEPGSVSAGDWPTQVSSADFTAEIHLSNIIQSGPNNDLQIDQSPCVAQGSLLEISEGFLPIEKARAGLALIGANGKPVSLVAAVHFQVPVVDFWRIEDGGLHLLLAAGHPILLDGQELLPEQVPGAQKVRFPLGKTLHTLITEERTYVRINGFSVATWGKSAWQNFIENDEMGRRLRFICN